MECGIACGRSGRVGPEALRATVPSHRYAGECHLAVGLNRAARQWPALQGSWPGRECRRVPGRRRGVGRSRDCLAAPRGSTTIVMSEFGVLLPVLQASRRASVAPHLPFAISVGTISAGRLEPFNGGRRAVAAEWKTDLASDITSKWSGLRACLKSPDREPFSIPTADAQLRRRGFSLCPN